MITEQNSEKTLSLHYLFFEHDPVPPPSDTPTLLDSNSLLNAYYNFRTVVHVRTACIQNITSTRFVFDCSERDTLSALLKAATNWK